MSDLSGRAGKCFTFAFAKAEAAGWKFDNITGQLIADDAAHDDR